MGCQKELFHVDLISKNSQTLTFKPLLILFQHSLKQNFINEGGSAGNKMWHRNHKYENLSTHHLPMNE